MEELKPLIRKRGIVKSGLTIFTNFLNEIGNKEQLDDLDIIKLTDRLANAEKLLHDFHEHQEQIELQCNESKIEEQVREREMFENNYYDAIASAKSVLQKFNDAVEVQSNNSLHGSINNSSSISVKLPDISLPKFDGKFEDWLEFRDIYSSLIHDNTSLDNTQKFHYLRGALSGTAAVAISKIKYTSSNYEVAWTLLQGRFNNKKKLIYEHIKAIFSVDNIQKPTSDNIQNLADDIIKHLGAIEQLGQNIKNWDPLLIFWLTNKLDSSSSLEWERETAKRDDLPKLDDFLAFLQRRANFMGTIESKSNLHINKQDSKTNSTGNRYSKQGNARCLTSTNYSCVYCKQDHSIYKCQEFINLDLPLKRNFVKKANLCYNCLRAGHSTKRCKLGPCRVCKSWHNTILHDKNESCASSSNQENNVHGEAGTSTTLSSGVTIPMPQQVILSTVCVLVADKFGKLHKVRALLDCGSQTSFITEHLLERLNIPTERTDLTFYGISNTNSSVDRKGKITIRAMHRKFEIECNCYVLEQITGIMPSLSFDTRSLAIPNDITLADPQFCKPGRIDILIGADIFWAILGENKISLGERMPILYETFFGWVVSGQMGLMETSKTSCNLSVNQELLDSLSKFWEIEEFQGPPQLSDIEQFCESNFNSTTQRDSHGRFIVTMPLKESPSVLGESRIQAERRFLALERKLQRNASLCSLYKDFMREYRNLNHMTMDNGSNTTNFEYFMPHHSVLKEDSLTTKLRVVFDASAPSSSGLSLNNIQAVGPKLQDDLLSIILRFRKHNYVISADIAKMYRQVLIAPEHRQLQKIVWRDNPDDNLETYVLNTVTYGQTSASYLATRCLLSLAKEVQESNPEMAEIIEHDFYVDDLLTGATTIDGCRFISKFMSVTLNSGGFPLRKWCSNNVRCLEDVNAGHIERDQFVFNNNENIKTLGLTWSCEGDILLYNINISPTKGKMTKRCILSTIARIFDPLGLLSPCIILAKMLLQKLWANGKTWDEPISGAILETWTRLEGELPILNELRLSRQATCKDATSVQLHGFSDASEKGYGACVYLRSTDPQGDIHLQLLCAKSKVAPLKSTSIRRLELCAALLLARLSHKVMSSTKINFESLTLWSDSTITLAWIRTSSNLLKTFTGNRVAEIQSLTKGANWRYVPTHDNRILYPEDFILGKFSSLTFGGMVPPGFLKIQSIGHRIH